MIYGVFNTAIIMFEKFTEEFEITESKTTAKKKLDTARTNIELILRALRGSLNSLDCVCCSHLSTLLEVKFDLDIIESTLAQMSSPVEESALNEIIEALVSIASLTLVQYSQFSLNVTKHDDLACDIMTRAKHLWDLREVILYCLLFKRFVSIAKSNLDFKW